MLQPGAKTRKEAEAYLLAKARQDKRFREQLISDPREVIASGLGIPLPVDLRITVLEENDKNIYLVLPARSAELDEAELAAVVGGRTRQELQEEAEKLAEAAGDSTWGKIKG